MPPHNSDSFGIHVETGFFEPETLAIVGPFATVEEAQAALTKAGWKQDDHRLGQWYLNYRLVNEGTYREESVCDGRATIVELAGVDGLVLNSEKGPR